MLTSLYQVLVQKLSLMHLPVYLSDCIPEGTGFPCITLEIAAPAIAAAAGKVTLTIWCRGGTANYDRFCLAEKLLAYLPARGVRLALDCGVITLQMSESAACVRSEDALGVKTQWTLHFYPSA